MAGEKKRLDPTDTTLRSLYIASGGICEMQDCNKRLTQPSGAWIGTVAHIVSAEDNGPRADKSMDPKDRRAASNLMLLCADHGREVDDLRTGEKLYPRERLEEIKRTHEARFSGLIDDMLASSRSRARSVGDFVDTAVGASVAGRTYAKFAEYWNLADGDPDLLDQACREFEESRRTLSQLSQAALGTLSWLLGLWESTLEAGPQGNRNFGDDWRGGPQIHQSLIHNRELNPQQLQSALEELEQRGILWPPSPDEYEYQERRYSIGSPWSTEWTTWRRIAEYLDRTHRSTVSSWVSSLDYSVFDELPGEGSTIRSCALASVP
jgi:hypothetical protein